MSNVIFQSLHTHTLRRGGHTPAGTLGNICIKVGRRIYFLSATSLPPLFSAAINRNPSDSGAAKIVGEETMPRAISPALFRAPIQASSGETRSVRLRPFTGFLSVMKRFTVHGNYCKHLARPLLSFTCPSTAGHVGRFVGRNLPHNPHKTIDLHVCVCKQVPRISISTKQ